MDTPPCTIHERDLSSDSSCRGLGLRVMENVPVANNRACFGERRDRLTWAAGSEKVQYRLPQHYVPHRPPNIA